VRGGTALLLGVTMVAGCGGSEVPGRVTFNAHVAPILFENCASCHRPGEVAPFPLLSYEDAKAHAAEIARETQARQMPPWLPEPGAYALEGVRRLSDAQIETLQRWLKQGMAEGDSSTRPAPPSFPAGWRSGTPDLVVTTRTPYRLPRQVDHAGDVYRNLVLRTSVPAATYVRAVEFKTNGAPIHHAVIRVDPTSASRRRDGQDGNAGFDGMSWNLADPDGQFLGWAPGRGPITSPAGMAWRLEPGMDLVVEVHMIPGSAAADIAPSVALYFADAPPTRTPVTVKMGSKLIDIPAGQKDYLITDTYEVPVGVSLMGVYPHAHFLGKDMHVSATFPDGTVKTLLHIARWDFHWQQDYRFVTPIALPQGTRLTMRYTFDNSSDNASNPSRPPVRVRQGPNSTDEMAELGLQFLTSSPGDRARLLHAFVEREQRANIAMAEQRVSTDPENAENRAFLGGSLVQAERFGEAVPHLEAALRLGDTTAATQSDLGAAMLALGRRTEALALFQRAAALAPNDEVHHFNVGTVLGALGRTAAADAAFRRSLALNPDYVDAHVNLGVSLIGQRRASDALEHFRRAAALQPDSARMHSNLGGALMAAGRHRDALEAIRRALSIEPDHGPARDNLRRLEAMGIK
jgi:tetratricopeptide (TPR) repeat protein